MKTKDVINSLTTVGATAGGAMVGRVIADMLPIKDVRVKHGVVALAGVLGASFLNSKNKTEALLQNVAMGVSAIQVGSLIKELAGDKAKGIVATALGSPYDDEIKFLSGADDYKYYDDYDFIPNDDEEYIYDDESYTPTIEFRQ